MIRYTSLALAGTLAISGQLTVTPSIHGAQSEDGGRALTGGGPCEGDLNGDAAVDFDDLLVVLANFDCPDDCPGDADDDGDVDFDDLLVVLGQYGCIPEPPFEHTTGEWQDYDLFLNPGHSDPGPTINTDCDERVVLYSVTANVVADCVAPGPIQDTVDEAIQNALDYFSNNFHCECPDCIQKAGRIVWTGWHCDEGNPTIATAAVLVEMWCEPEL